MMEPKIYAIIEIDTGLVINMTLWDGISEYNPGNQYELVQTDVAWIGWSYSNRAFYPPPIIPPTPEQILAVNTSAQANLLAQASHVMAPILVALPLEGDADEVTVRARAWRSYYQDLQAVDLRQEEPVWPQSPE